ncbi:MAG: aminotransferase class V-fold PLP-dependent enzyme [Actinomycetota bacterium]|nr:aminotransferase class V-fold PLP-dependent enzyme [Actinomycetota bacterium]
MNREYLDEFEERDGYLNYASVGPPSRSARDAAGALLDEVALGERAATQIIGPAYQNARERIARALGVGDGFVTSVPSTSAGIMQVSFGLVGSGGNVVVPAHEFPANRYPWLRAESVGGPEVRVVEIPDRRVTPETLSDAIDDETRLVAVSLVDYMTGFRVDVDSIAEAAGDALVLVDGIQGLGAVETGLGSADVFVAGGQKWLRAGFSAGVMAVSPRVFDRLEPTLTGWWSVEDGYAFEVPPPHPALATADRFLEGSPNLLGAVAAAAAMDVVDVGGIANIEAAVLERSGAILDLARSLDADVIAPWRSDGERAGIVTFRVPGLPANDAVESLATAGFVVSERNGWIRVSPHATTPMRVIEEFGATLRDQVRKA